MSLPTLAKSWYFQVNQQISAQTSLAVTNARALRTIKDALLGLGSWTDNAGGTVTPSNNWTVVGSSNGSVAALDGVDRWASDTDITWMGSGASAHSWMILKQTAIGSNFQFLINCRGDDTGSRSSFIEICYSPNAGFTGGSTSARPTATDEIVPAFIAAWGPPNANASYRVHILRSSDGKNFRIFLCRSSFVVGFWSIEAAGSPVTGWTYPFFVGMRGTQTTPASATVVSYANYCSAATMQSKGPTATMLLYLTSECVRSGTVPVGERMSAINDLSGSVPFLPMGLYSDVASNQGRIGVVNDMWWGLPNLSEATTYPNDGTRQFCQFGHTIQPWNGTVPIFV